MVAEFQRTFYTLFPRNRFELSLECLVCYWGVEKMLCFHVAVILGAIVVLSTQIGGTFYLRFKFLPAYVAS